MGPDIARPLRLAVGAEMGAASAEDDAADGRSADETGLALASVDAMLDLEETGLAVGVDVIGNGGASGADGRFED